MTNTYIPHFKKWIPFLFLMLHINTNAQTIKEFIYEKPESNTGLKIRGLKGKIKSTKTCFFKIESTPKQGNIKRLLDPNIYGLYEVFNDSGKLIKYCLLEPPVYFPMNTTDGDSLVYNSKGKLEKLFYTSGTGISFIKTFNNKEDIISNEVKNDEDLSSLINNYYSYKYNAAGKKTETVEYSEKDKKNIDARSIYKYDNKGRPIEQLIPIMNI